ncbi:MAG TPA: nitroreductase family protein [Acidimicrobiales bacterium]|jgi:nitroreductase|nr:nitroreductase family protein [Acidimicrobiales bacterium]
MALDLTPDELLTTTRAVRRRLDLDRPVERSLVEECVAVALQAPTGSNRQGWHFVLVDDPETRGALAACYAAGFDPYAARPAPEYPPDDPRQARRDAVRSSATYLRQHLHEVPVLLVPCIEGRPPGDGTALAQASFWGSLLPAVWSFMLAARSRGLGTSFTTLHLTREEEAAGALGVPADTVTQGGLIPVAHTKGTDFSPAPRLSPSSVIHWNRW